MTGGTGSFGSTMVKYLAQHGAGEVRVLSRDEVKQEMLRYEVSSESVNFYLGDVRDESHLGEAIRGVDYVFHAAALKQVPPSEFFPWEAVKTNVIGSENVLRHSIAQKVKSVVALSTDKAVYPINAMGISKAMLEKYVLAFARSSGPTRLNVTRYGNVLMSRGSVVPRFIELARAGKKLTVTEGTMTRFVMSLEDSVDLVLDTLQSDCSGSIRVRKAKATSVMNLAKAVNIIFGRNPNEIEVIGGRHGEKLHEDLISAEESLRAIDQGDYLEIPSDPRGLDYAAYFEGDELSSDIARGQSFSSSSEELQLGLEAVIDVLSSQAFVLRALAEK